MMREWDEIDEAAANEGGMMKRAFYGKPRKSSEVGESKPKPQPEQRKAA
jgi:hypothetical protein